MSAWSHSTSFKFKTETSRMLWL